MRLSLLLSLVFLCCLSGCPPKIQAVEDLAAITAMFGEFRSAVNRQKGAEAVQLVTSDSVKRYEQFRDWAINDTAEELAERSVVEQVEIARLKATLTPEQLSSFDGHDIIRQLVDQGRLDLPFVESAQLADPVFQKDKCYMQIFDRSGAVKEKLTFFREDGKWKIDIPSLEFIHEKIYSRMLRREDKTPEQVVASLVEAWEASDETATSATDEDEVNTPQQEK